MPDEPNSNGQTPPASKPPETFSAQYVAELRAENEKLRKTLSERDSSVEESRKAVETMKKEHKDALDAERAAFRNKLLLREVQSALVSDGFIDKDIASLLAPKVVEEGKLSMDDKDAITGLKEAVEALKKSKPELFRTMQATSAQSGSAQPAPGQAAPVDALKLSDAEFSKLMSGMGISL